MLCAQLQFTVAKNLCVRISKAGNTNENEKYVAYRQNNFIKTKIRNHILLLRRAIITISATQKLRIEPGIQQVKRKTKIATRITEAD